MNHRTLSPRRLSALALGSCLLLTAGAAGAHEYHAAGFTLIHPWAEATPPGVPSAPVYFSLEGVRTADRLLRADAPCAERVELRGGGDPSAPALAAIDLAPADSLDFGPGRPHLLLRGLKAPLQWGRSYQMTLVFEKAGPVQVMISIGAH